MLGNNKTQEHKFLQQPELSDAEMEKLSGGGYEKKAAFYYEKKVGYYTITK